MFDNYYRKDISWGGQLLTLETGKVARQADGAVMARLGDTIVLCTVVGSRSVKPGQDFFPLTVNYQEKAFAAGKIPGGFFKREGRPSEHETLVSRLIDRPIRPLFPEGFRNEIQVIATVLGRADPFGHPVLRPYRRRAHRLRGRPVRAESDRGAAQAERAGPRSRRHAGRRADG